jgi:hypothetical protein
MNFAVSNRVYFLSNNVGIHPGVNFLSLVHLNQRSRWTIAITWHPASVVGKLFTFQVSSPKPLKDIPMIIHLQFGFSQFISFREEDLWNFSQSEHIIGPGSYVEYPTGTKNLKFVEDHPRNIPATETTNMIKAKLYMNVHWMVLYNRKVFYSDMKFKMVATARLSLTLDLAAMLNIRLEQKT